MPQPTFQPKNKRPWQIIVLTLVILLFAGLHWLRFVMSIQQWQTLENMPISVSPRYLALTGIGWGLVSLPFVWGVWKGKGWARAGVQISALLYTLAFWIDALWIATPEIAQTRWPFSLILSILALVALFAALHCPTSRRFFDKTQN